MVSVAHDLEVTLPLLPNPPPPKEPENSAVDNPPPENNLAAEGEDAGARPSSASAKKMRQPSADVPLKRPSSAETRASAEVPACGGETTGCEGGAGVEGGDNAWEEREVPASADSFFFEVPPLPTPAPGQASA